MMKPIRQYTILVLLSAGLTSCEKVINVNIDNAQSKYVIQGTISNTNDSCEVQVSRTLNLTDPNKFIGVDHAAVTISEKGGKTVTLKSGYSGIYRYPMKGVPGKTYLLTVKVGEQVFTAASTMPAKVPVDSVFLVRKAILGKPKTVAAIAFTDPAGVGNNYRFFQLIDGERSPMIFILTDKLIDGNHVKYELDDYGNINYTLHPTDNVTILMRCIDYNNYLFLWSLTQENLGGGTAASPGNPVTNISGGALGYFSAHTSEFSETIFVR